ncbi:gamma-glutamylputrescine oxidoreductase [Pyronema omphalodes]|nr:gamma-glutamylputrescine oxidoreductase [Pyronema omphalodes]
MNRTSGYKQPVWISTEPYSNFPKFPKLAGDVKADVVIVGGGIAGISVAYECVKKGVSVALIEARNTLSGESGRTSGHLASSLDDRYYSLIKTFGEEGARQAFDSHQYALERIGEIAAAEGIECEYRHLPGSFIVEVPDTDPSYSQKNDLGKESEALHKLGIDHIYTPHGKMGAAYTGAILTFKDQATFHPTKYLNGLLKVMQEKYGSHFQAYAQTRMDTYKDTGDSVIVTTEGKHTLEGKHLVMATNVPMQKIEVIGKQAYYRTYCIAMKAPKGAYEDLCLYDNGDPYVYVRKTAHPDKNYEYIIVGGEDHKVGQETPEGYGKHYQHLEAWTRKHYPFVLETEYRWSGQIVEPNDHIAFIGQNTGSDKNVYISTGDSGNGLTHGVIAGKLLTDLMMGLENKWSKLYDPSRKPKKDTISELVSENLNQNAQYARWIKTDVNDIEDIPRCAGAVMHGGLSKLGKPIAVYKDGDGNVVKFSAVCPHAKGIVAWNSTEMSWDCPVHGSRFDGLTGKCVMGPSIHGLAAENEAGEKAQEGESG